MKRIDKIYHQPLDNFREKNINQLLKIQGNSAKEIAGQPQMERSNVSFELNNLVRAKKVIKIKTFPVRYIPVEIVENVLNIKWNSELMEVEELRRLADGQKKPARNISADPLELMIGAKGSLKKAISQAKAAVFYPPHGLHMPGRRADGFGEIAVCESDLPVRRLF